MDTSQYFYRNVILSKKDNKVSLIDIHNPDRKGQALDPWLRLVLQYANGHRTVQSKTLLRIYQEGIMALHPLILKQPFIR